MKKNSVLLMIGLILLGVLLSATSVRAQLVIEDRNFRVVKADWDHHRIEVTRIDEEPIKATGYVYVFGKTKCLKDGQHFDWTKIGKGWKIRVRGGMRFDTNINAKEIWIIDTK